MTTTTTISGQTVKLAAPPKFSTRWAIIRAYNAHREMPDLVFCAALGACWASGKGRPQAAYTYDPLAYGAAVMDDLTGRGWDVGEVLNAGSEALVLILREQYPADAEVEAALGNDEAPTGNTTE